MAKALQIPHWQRRGHFYDGVHLQKTLPDDSSLSLSPFLFLKKKKKVIIFAV